MKMRLNVATLVCALENNALFVFLDNVQENNHGRVD